MVKALVYDSSPLPKKDRLQNWYQCVILGLALGSMALPLLYYVLLFIQYKTRLYRAKPRKIRIEKDGKLSESLKSINNVPYRGDIPTEALSIVRSYALCTNSRLSHQQEELNNLDMVSLRLEADVSDFQFRSGLLVLAHCEEQVLVESMPSQGSAHDHVAAFMSRIHVVLSKPNSPYVGVILQLSPVFTAEVWMTLCHTLRSLNLLVVLELGPDYTALVGINLKMVDGLIIRNGTTLSTGLRRDFFRGFELRDVLGRCSKQRTKRPQFLTILHDPCSMPSTPTIRRAFKFSRFHEVLLCICSTDMSSTPGCLPLIEPFSAFDWLKRVEVLDFHRAWNQSNIAWSGEPTAECNLVPLEPIFPGIIETFTSKKCIHTTSEESCVEIQAPLWVGQLPSWSSYFSISETGQILSTRACYELRCPIVNSQVETVLNAQRHLRKLNLLQELTIYETQEVLDRLTPFIARIGDKLTLPESADLANLVLRLKEQSVRIFRGLDSGFTLPEDRFRIWSVSEVVNGVEFVYASLKISDLTAVLIHQFLLCRGITRRRCFEIEHILDIFEGQVQVLPSRLITELRSSTHAELLTHLQNIRRSEDVDCQLLNNVADFAKFLLLNETTRQAWQTIHGHKLLSGELTFDEVYRYRPDWYFDQGVKEIPSITALTKMHQQVESGIVQALRSCDTATIEAITWVICEAYKNSNNLVSITADLLGLMVLCAFRKFGIEETYIESSDRCPLYHFQRDQPGVFSELWVIGSQCEIYFDVTPAVLGGMHYDKYRAYLEQHPPPANAWNGKDLFSAYHKVENPSEEGIAPGDDAVSNPFKTKGTRFFPRIQKFAFLTIFCLPTVCDLMLLVFFGRGLFQTAFMGAEDVQYGIIGLLTALLLCSGTIAWIGSSGGYYLYKAAFDSLNHLMVQKLSGGILLTFAVGILGAVGIGAQVGWYAGMIFFAYLMVFAIYLNILGILATMHLDDAPFPSGRATLWKTFPILVISPIVTTFIHGYDVLIYLTVDYTFLFMLYRNYRNLCIEWSQWHRKVRLIDDAKVLSWYGSVSGLGPADVKYEIARKALEEAVISVRQRHARFSLFTTCIPRICNSPHRQDPAGDSLVQELAPGLEYSKWLLAKDAEQGFSTPAPYSSDWNNSLKVSLNTYQLFIRGLKEHSAFLQFRYAKNDIAFNVVMFLAVLLDRWVAITMSAAGNGPINLYGQPRNRFAISFALSFFLTSAVALDYQLQYCWAAVVTPSDNKLRSLKQLDREELSERQRKKKLYWTTLRDLLVTMCFLFGVWTTLLVFWVDDAVQLETYFAYVVAYCFVIWFQFNRVFIKNGTRAFLITCSAITIGYLVGVVLHLIPRTYDWHFIDVVALGTGTSLAGFGSFYATDFGSGAGELLDEGSSSETLAEKSGARAHSQKFIGLDYQDSEKLEKSLNVVATKISTFKTISVSRTSYVSLFTAITEQFNNIRPNSEVITAYPDWSQLVGEISRDWQADRIRLKLVSHLVLQNLGIAQVAAFGLRTEADILEVFVPVAILTEDWLLSHDTSVVDVIVQALIHEALEHLNSLSHSDAACGELLVVDNPLSEIPRRIELQINTSDVAEAETIMRRTNAEVLSHLCLGYSVNTQWTHLPEDIRLYIIHRVQGRSHRLNLLSAQHIRKSSPKIDQMSWRETVLRSDLKLQMALNIHHKCKTALDHGLLQLLRQKHGLSAVSKSNTSLVRRNHVVSRIYYGIYLFFQYIAVISVGDSDVPRELVYITRGTMLRRVVRVSLLSIWRICLYFRHFLIELTLFHSRSELTELVQYCRFGFKRALYDTRITVEHPSGGITGFRETLVNGIMCVNVFNGLHVEVPKESLAQVGKLLYNSIGQLMLREVVKDGTVLDTYTYAYDATRRLARSRKQHGLEVFYDEHGRISHGQILARDGDIWNFRYTFTDDNSVSEILSAVYTSSVEYIAIHWSVPRTTGVVPEEISEAWGSASKVTKTVHVKDGVQWFVQYTYHHKRDPIVKCLQRTGQAVKQINTVPEWIAKDFNNFCHKPVVPHFDTEDLFFRHSLVEPLANRCLRRLSWSLPRIIYSKLGTGQLRTMLWSQWHNSTSLDGVVCCYLDEMLLRNENALGPYWTARQAGRFSEAVEYLDKHLDFIGARIDIEDSVSQNTFLPYKIMDLYTMGTGGSAIVKTRQFEDNYCDSEDRLSVMFLDTGCFPDQPGGVSNCRRDLVNGHTTIRNHVFTESANDFGIPRFQVDRNIQSIKVLPLWGLDYLSPYHGLFENLLDSQVRYREHHTTEEDIRKFFLPILITLIKGARSQNFTQKDLAEYTQAFVDLSIYFEEKDFLKTWNSEQVKRTWRQCWLEDIPNSVSISTYFTLELPTMSQLDEAMELWRRYLFVFSVRIPEEVPKVFQCTHHGVGSIFGMLLKVRRGTTYLIWDHAIYWRESCLNISSSQCVLPLSVQNMLLGIIKMASHVCYTHADIILPCTNLFNPGWEMDIGSDLGQRQHTIGFARKIDPVVNGISDMERFEPVDKIRSVNPTVMMLSNVQFIKDVKNAVYSADIIVNQFKFSQYQLVIYGSLDRTPQYTADTEAIIKNRGLENNVRLAGFGDPKEILKDAWAFMNSSLSEGLPLAIGEAALSGCPVIATDVGATALVISDPKNPKVRYGEIVPPNDSIALARAQIQILAMLGPWTSYCDDNPPPMPERFTLEDVKWITQRMYDKTEERRTLGRKGRETVLQSFNGNRYLREHEQMFWIGSYRSQQRANDTLNVVSNQMIKFDEVLAITPVIQQRKSKLWDENPWRYFADTDGFFESMLNCLKRFRKRSFAS